MLPVNCQLFYQFWSDMSHVLVGDRYWILNSINSLSYLNRRSWSTRRFSLPSGLMSIATGIFAPEEKWAKESTVLLCAPWLVWWYNNINYRKASLGLMTQIPHKDSNSCIDRCIYIYVCLYVYTSWLPYEFKDHVNIISNDWTPTLQQY